MGKRIVVAILLTLIILSVTRRLSVTKPRDIEFKEAGIEVFHRTLPGALEFTKPCLNMRVRSDDTVSCYLEILDKGGIKKLLPMHESSSGVWYVDLPAYGRGTKVKYALLIETSRDGRIRIPEEKGGFFTIKYKGKISDFVLVSHIVFMFASFFFMVLALFGAVRILKGLEGKKVTANLVRWVLFTTFVGGWPLGCILNYQAFGVIWEGFPFGYDVTDNKTQIMFVFWIVTSILAGGSIFMGDESRDKLDNRQFAISVIVSVIVSIGVFLIPHSL